MSGFSHAFDVPGLLFLSFKKTIILSTIDSKRRYIHIYLRYYYISRLISTSLIFLDHPDLSSFPWDQLLTQVNMRSYQRVGFCQIFLDMEKEIRRITL